LEVGSVVRLGGMTDCFQPCEKVYKNTYNTINILNRYGIHYLIVTKSDLVADDDYIKTMDKELAHIQITVTSTDDSLAKTYERAVPPSMRIKAIEKLYDNGFDVQMRLSPFIDEFLDFNVINNVRCDKVIVEFLRANTFIKKTFPQVDYSKYTHKEGGYNHLELENKKELIKKLTGFKEVSVCEDCTEAYDYWQNNFNPNKEDCCNLRYNKK
jgi:DNA repair photolyase